MNPTVLTATTTADVPTNANGLSAGRSSFLIEKPSARAPKGSTLIEEADSRTPRGAKLTMRLFQTPDGWTVQATSGSRALAEVRCHREGTARMVYAAFNHGVLDLAVPLADLPPLLSRAMGRAWLDAERGACWSLHIVGAKCDLDGIVHGGAGETLLDCLIGGDKLTSRRFQAAIPRFGAGATVSEAYRGLTTRKIKTPKRSRRLSPEARDAARARMQAINARRAGAPRTSDPTPSHLALAAGPRSDA